MVQEETQSDSSPYFCKVTVHNPIQKRRNCDPKSEGCMLVGYATNIIGYRFYNSRKHQVTTSRNEIFLETVNNIEMPRETSDQLLSSMFPPVIVNQATESVQNKNPDNIKTAQD